MVTKIVLYPSPLLRDPKTTPLGRATHNFELRRLIALMRDTMYAQEAVGLAAPQVGALQRVFLIDGKVVPGASGDPPPLVFVNPRIVWRSSDSVHMTEGCLSFPSAFLPVARPRDVRVEAEDANGQPFELKATGLLARAIFHENDHLDGVLMIDHVDRFLRERAQSKVKRWRLDHGM